VRRKANVQREKSRTCAAAISGENNGLHWLQHSEGSMLQHRITSGTKENHLKLKAQRLYLIAKFYLFDLPQVLGESRHSTGYKKALQPGL